MTRVHPAVRALLLAAAWLAALAPLLAHSHGMQTASAGWAEVCSSAGRQWVAVDRSPESQPLRLSECLQCLSCAGSGAAPPPAPLSTRAPAPLIPLPLLASRAPRPLITWAPAQPRGPPSVS